LGQTPSEDALNLNSLLPVQREIVNKTYDDKLWNESKVLPAEFYFDERDVAILADVDLSSSGYAVTLALPEMKYAAGISKTDAPQHVGISIRPSGESSYPGFTLRPPYLPGLNDVYGGNILVVRHNLRTEPGGFGVTVKTSDNSLVLHPMAYSAVIEGVCEFCGMRAELSQAGLLTRRIIEQFGGLNRTGILRVPGVRNLLRQFKPDESINRKRAAEVIHDRGSLDRHTDVSLGREIAPGELKYAIFDHLLEKGVLRPGLEIPCDHCRLTNWLTPRGLDDIFLCVYCGHENKTNLLLHRFGEWKYRKSGLFSRQNNQEGAVPVILTLHFFERRLSMAEFFWSTSLKLTVDGRECETDLFALHANGRDVQVVIGECKSAGGIIDDNDMENLPLVRQKFIEQDIMCYLVFAKAADAYSGEEIGLFKRLLADDIPVILLTNREFESSSPYRGGDVPKAIANSLGDMAVNSEHRYLKNTDPGHGEATKR
jgi:hypothetical protein